MRKRLASVAAATALFLLPAGPLFADGPPVQIHFRDSLCYGFPGCPDSYLFLVPPVIVLMMLKFSRNVYVLAGTWAGSLVVLALLLDVNPIRVSIYLLGAVAVGMVWLAFGGARR